MSRSPIPPIVLNILLWVAIALPIVNEVLFLVSLLLAEMGDELGRTILAYVIGGGRIVWGLVLVFLVLVLAIHVATQHRET